jgi:cell fate (sporulation/competence/biofilm development) regulator YmcA (YheA/YmcA/DUF963 family)
MKMYTKKDLEEYLKNDFILSELGKYPEDATCTSHTWLLDLPEKRIIYADVYGDLLKTSGKKILDIGGAFCGLSRELVKNHQYTVVDIMAHDDHEALKQTENTIGNFWVNADWNDFVPDDTYDYIIANDLFPNVDQRLEAFVNKFKSHAKKMILTLTAYDKERSYKVKRVDADEILFIRPWDSEILSIVLKKLSLDSDVVKESERESIFKNGRIVYKLEI